MPIDDLARGDVLTAGTDAPTADLAEAMADNDVGSVVIVEGETPVGIVTDRDLAIQVVAERANADETTAADVMSEDLLTVERNAGFYEAAQLMSDRGVRRLPVCDADDDLVGIITADDLTELLADEQQRMAEIVRAQRPPY